MVSGPGDDARVWASGGFDQRWHGQGISARFLLEDCADDVAALADVLGVDRFVPVGYSMGSLVAQLVWYRHRERLDGLVLGAAATEWWNGVTWERLGAGALAALIEAFSPRPGLPAAAASNAESYVRHNLQWMLGQVRSTSPGGIARAVAEITRFDSTSWVAKIDVATAVLIPLRDRAIPPRQQFWLANQIPKAHVVTVDAGHTCCTLQYEKFVAALREAVDPVRQQIPRGRERSDRITQGLRTCHGGGASWPSPICASVRQPCRSRPSVKR